MSDAGQTKPSSTANQIPSCEDLVARASGLVADIAARAAETEATCHVSEETVAAFRATNLHKTLLPAAYGGYEMGFSAMLDTSFAVGKVCASSAWVLGLYMVHTWFGSLFPKECQDDMWGRNSGAFISGSYAPVGKASVAPGGFRLSGRFPFSSGVPGADWNLCAAMLPIGPDATPVPCFTLVPKKDYRIDWDSWRTVGQAGTGSFDVHVEDAFVPAHRVLSFSDSLGGNSPGGRANTNPLYRMSLLTCVPFALAIPAVAAAAGALDAFIEENRSRKTHGAVVLGGNKVAEFQTVQKRMGEAAARIDACMLLAHRDIKEAEAEVRRDGMTSMDTRLRNRRTQAFITHEAQTAMNLIFDAVGGRCLQQHHPVQRAWRDVGAIAHHISLNFDAVMSMYGQHVFGLKLQGQY